MSVPPLKFAVVREDAEIEARLCERARAVLTVASGGCTALALAARFPALAVTAFDINPTQLAHVAAKRDAVFARATRALNVDDTDPRGLNQRGAFEGLFRILRQTLIELVVPEAALEELFDPLTPDRARDEMTDSLLRSPAWPAAFTTAFNDGLLHALFGPAATQHARPGSYPAYFQAAFARALRAPEATRNPFLQHVFLGRYRGADAPAYVTSGRHLELELVQGTLSDVPAIGRFQVISLSNVFDWSDDQLVASWAETLKREATPGCAIVMRQLNNRRDLRRFFAPEFAFDDDRARAWLAGDRSFFYERLEIGIRR